MSTRPFITCHVLDTTSGKPAAGIHVVLKLLSPGTSKLASERWHSKTNSDGRVAAWESEGSYTVNEVVDDVKATIKDDEHMVWSLTFATEEYFGKGNTFWPEVELKFAAKKTEEHYHVPLLLTPWSYTTYRGS